MLQRREGDAGFEPVAELLDAERLGVQEPRADGRDGQHDEGDGERRRRFVRLAVTTELAEERQVHATGHVRGGQERPDQADVQEGVEAGLPGGDEDLVLRPEPGEGEDAGQRERSDDECRERDGHVLAEPAHVALHVEAVMRPGLADRPRPEEEE